MEFTHYAHEQSSLDVASILKEVLGEGDYCAYEDHGALNTHGVYTLSHNKIFVKIATTTRSSASLLQRFLTEPRNAHWAQAQGVSIANPLPYLFTVKLPTEEAALSLWELLPLEDFSQEEALAPLLEEVKRLAQLEKPAWAPIFDDTPFIERAKATLLRLAQDDEEAKWALDLLSAHSTLDILASLNELPFVVCHGDPHPGNLIKTASGFFLCDWESFKWAPLEFDAGQLLRHYPEAKSQILAMGDLEEELVVASGVIRACSALAHNLNINQPHNATANRARAWLKTLN